MVEETGLKYLGKTVGVVIMIILIVLIAAYILFNMVIGGGPPLGFFGRVREGFCAAWPDILGC